MASLTRRLENEIVGKNKRGTIDYFRGELGIDDPNKIAFSMAELQSQMKVELIGTKTSYAGNGLPVHQGVYAVSPEALADKTIKGIEELDRKFNVDPRGRVETYDAIREMIISIVRNARKRN